MNERARVSATACCLLAASAVPAAGVERAMPGDTPSRNMASPQKGLPTEWDLETGKNIRWVAELGSETHAGPVVAGGKVFVGTNDEREYNDKRKGDRANLMAIDAETGKLLWRSAHDGPLQGVRSTPFVEGDRVYYVSNRAEVVSADTEGFRDGENDGPFVSEGEEIETPGGTRRVALTGEIDEDVVWKYVPDNLAAGSPLIVGDVLFTVTGHRGDDGQAGVRSPRGPSLIALNRRTGKLVWESSGPAEEVLHGSGSDPSYGEIQGRPQVFFPGGDGWLYSFKPGTGELLGKVGLDPAGFLSTPVVHGDRVYVGAGQDPRHDEGPGGFWAIDATKLGDVTTAIAWHAGGGDFHRTLSTASIADGLLYIADLGGFVRCFDLDTGALQWKYDTLAAIRGSTLVADGKVYVGDEDGDIAVLQAGREMKLLAGANMGAAVPTTPAAGDGVLYVASSTRLFAIAEER
jgi:outer membrane protein assembly factor BamB